MSTEVFETPKYTPDNFKRFDIPVKMGILTGIVLVVLSVVNYMFVLPANYIAFLVMTVVLLIASVVLYAITATRQRAAMGGYINLKDTFQAVFIAILISTLISSVWGIIYAKVIDPHVIDKVKESTLAFMQRMKVPEDRLDQTAADLDKQAKESLNIGNLFYNYAKGLILYGIIGFIIAAIVRRNPPVEMR